MTREEAIKTIRLTCPKISDSECDFETAMRFLIPELAESEDERIREEIVDYFKKECECLLNDFRDKEDEKQLSFYKKAIAWLEKQKESLHIPETCKENADSFTDEDERIRKSLIEIVERFMDGERKEKTLAFLEKQKEQKHEWSDEDEEKLKAICTYLLDYPRLAKLGDKLRFNEYCDFLKSLRPSWKPSEEQMEALEECGECKRCIKELYEQLKKLM